VTSGPQTAVPFGPWLLLKRLAVGGMAELYLAKDTRTDRLVVLKRILPYLAQEAEFVRMFLDEARIAASLHHPNIAEVFELGHLEGSTFIAMEWVDGMDLRRVLQQEQARGSVVPPGIAAWLVARLCEGLAYAHLRTDDHGEKLGIIHRDVSPQNVMVSFRGDVKLVDFGIAKATAWMSRSKPGVIKGKFLYLAPEQLTQDRVDWRADLFAIGVLLYELTCGKTPFHRTSTEAVIYAIRMEEAQPPTQARAGFPPMLSRIIMKCLQKERPRRYQTGEEVKAALEDFLRAEAPTTRADVVRYVHSLFGDEEERTSIYVPPSPNNKPAAEPARPPPTGDGPGAPEATVSLVPGPFDDLSNEHTVSLDSVRESVPEGRKPTADLLVGTKPAARDTTTTAKLDREAHQLASEDTAVSVSGAKNLLVGDVLPGLMRTEIGPSLKPTPSPLTRRPGPPVPDQTDDDDLPEVDSVVSGGSPTSALSVEELTPVSRPARPSPTAPMPPVLRPRDPLPTPPAPPRPSTRQQPARRPVVNKRPVPIDPDDLIATADSGVGEVSMTSPGQGRRVLLSIAGLSVVAMVALLAVLFWPSGEKPVARAKPKPAATAAERKPSAEVTENSAVSTALEKPRDAPPPRPSLVKVSLRIPHLAQLVRVDGAAVAAPFEHAPGPVKVSWRCPPARRKGRATDKSATYDIELPGPVMLELSCP
jgi:eukaryotic-like serine/threonine-protein kinase